MSSEWARRRGSLVDGYVPPDEPQVDPSVAFHREYAEELDPITFEVIRSRLWNVNWDHQQTIRRVSGSGVVVYGYDFNTSIQTEIGEGVVFGPGNIFFAGCADVAVKWTLEHRSGSVGIEDGDVFIHDDPWVGTNHQMDTAVFAPVFVDGRIFSWVFNVVHQRELGGVEPGGFVQSATDVHSEPSFWPPTKLVSCGAMREDVADAWTRRSRLPELLQLELKSQIAGIDFARRRMLELVEKYGATVVKGVMQRMIDDTASAVRRRLRELPEATWRDVCYAGGAGPGDRAAHRLELRARHEDGHLYISNEGTERSSGSFNCSFGQFRAAVLNAAIPLLAYDQFLCGAGVLRCMTFEPAHDAITSASHPAAVSTAMGNVMATYQASRAFGAMVGCSPDQRLRAMATSGLHTPITSTLFGVDQYGERYANFAFDGVVGALGAFSWRDGLDHGGSVSSTINPVGSVEVWEREIPFLYLYRQEVPGSGGHGKWRGGATFVSGWTGHRTEESYISSGGLYQALTLGIGLAGGMPATGGTMWTANDTAIEDELAAGRLPASPEELRELCTDGFVPPPKKYDNRLAIGDVFELMPTPGGGYGDPLLREPELVVRDLVEGRVTPDQVTRIYAVALDDADGVDVEGTAALRRSALAERIAAASQPAHVSAAGGELVADGNVLETVLILRDAAGASFYGCAQCGVDLAEAGVPFQDGCGVIDLALPSLDERLFADPQTVVDDRVVVRMFVCPHCGYALETVVALADRAPEWTVLLTSGEGEH
ncbi:MAG TPA: hydantoinase B/oxoprolinase family protein [Conexibacter sp.]|nr:hydantoinase B/oxoprolinase family protein [Conexibacter sp.]